MERVFEKLDRLEAADEVDIRAWMREFEQLYMRLPAEERAYKFIKWFGKIEKPNDRLHGRFGSWLTNGYEAEAKEKALQRWFEEQLVCETYGKTATVEGK